MCHTTQLAPHARVYLGKEKRKKAKEEGRTRREDNDVHCGVSEGLLAAGFPSSSSRARSQPLSRLPAVWGDDMHRSNLLCILKIRNARARRLPDEHVGAPLSSRDASHAVRGDPGADAP